MRHIIFIALILSLHGLPGEISAQENWPLWRGPAQNGVSQSTGVPVTWSQAENIVWKTRMPSWSGSTPIIWGDRIFVTSPTTADVGEAPESTSDARGSGRWGVSRHPGGPDLTLMCINKQDGSVLWQVKLDDGNRTQRKQNMSSPSPVTDGTRVWVVTGTGMITALDMNGKKLWQKNLQEEYGPFGHNWGYASSPLLHDGQLITEVLHGMKTDDPSYIVAFDAMTGRENWRQERPTDAINESPDAYTTPTVLRHNGKTEIVISGGDYVTGHDPKTGREIWRAWGLNPENRRDYRIVSSPIAINGMVYAPTRNKPLLALRAGGAGDITKSHLVWKWEGPAAPDVPTPATDGTYFYMVDDNGLIICLDARTGNVIWGPERTAQGIVSASPVLVDNKVYIINESAVTTVLAAGPNFKKLATNELDGSYTLSTPTFSGGRIYLRTSEYLYCIGEGTGGTD